MPIPPLRAIGVLPMLATALSALAQQTQEPMLPAVTVTANKQAQALERVPASVTVFDGEQLEVDGVRGLEGVAAMTPGFVFQTFGQSGAQPPVMRGLSANVTSFSSSTALVVDGVATLRGLGFDDALLGVERVEVLRGPQSTLYGRNAEAGVVNIVTRRPGNEPYAAVSLDLGSRNKQALRFDASRALVDNTLFLGVAGEFARQDGFIDNTTTGRKEDDRQRKGGRVALRWTPSARTDATLRLNQREHDDGGSLWGPTGGPRETVRSGTESWNRSKARSASLDVSHELADDLRLRSITARNEYFDRILQDTDFQPADLVHLGRDYHFKTVSQELRLEGKAGEARWVAGVYLDREDNALNFEQKTPFALARTRSTQQGNSTAAFTHWDVPLTVLGSAFGSALWSIQAGLRVERDEMRFALAGGSEQSRSWTHASPKLALQYQWQPAAQLYASVSDGFRAGGFNTFAPETHRRYEPEKVRAFELGAKGHLLNRRLRYSAAVYRMDIDDMQVQQMGSAAGQVFMTNAASARSTGAEAELRWLIGTGWQVQTGFGLNHTRFREFRDGANDHTGKRNPFAPDINGHLGVRYDAPTGWFAQAQAVGAGKVYVDAANTAANKRSGYAVINLSAGYAWGRTELTAYVNNAANKHYDVIGFPASTITIYSPPREAGLRLSFRL
ncbi:iron complex outermembrane receptor protein [Paucibacter oligotrophus]|uniref:Iron complex outermembrane receptor protein n=1 Tax=Roseateles oligotrophus TaxID=1769250 RepID=A0A840LGI4_9BURK|nr:TonB-dependent receptor [Roseateles oligotrophus]MBB4844397.1 iron complex outermembrane receptor protein [Roseateles oligotrophus]